VANKEKLNKLKRFAKKQALELFAISAVTGEGIEKLTFAIAEKVVEVRKSVLRKESAGPPTHESVASD